MNEILLTKLGENNLKNKLKELKNKIKYNIINEISLARKLGDLSENSEYHSAKKEQVINEKKISELEKILLNCKVVDPLDVKEKNKINFSATIKLRNLENNEIKIFQIVGDEEININSKNISINSPIAKLLIGKSENEIVSMKKFGKIVKFKILSIEYI